MLAGSGKRQTKKITQHVGGWAASTPLEEKNGEIKVYALTDYGQSLTMTGAVVLQRPITGFGLHIFPLKS